VYYSLCIKTPPSLAKPSCMRPSEYCGHSAMGCNVCSASVTAVSYPNNGATGDVLLQPYGTAACMGSLLTAWSMRGMDDGRSNVVCITTWVHVLISLHHFHSTMPLLTCNSIHTTSFHVPESNFVVSYLRQCHSVAQVFWEAQCFCLVNSRQHRTIRSL
jgi:hypothetical protein